MPFPDRRGSLTPLQRRQSSIDVAEVLNIAYTSSMNSANIQSGFRRTGLWFPTTLRASIAPLRGLNFYGDTTMTLEELLQEFSRRGRSLLRDTDIEEQGTVHVSTRRGALLTNDAVIDALMARSSGRQSRENAADLRRLASLAPNAKSLAAL